MSGRGRSSAGAAPCVSVGGFVAFAEGVEAVAYRQHHITCERVISRVVDIVCRYATAHVGALSEDVVGFESDGGISVTEELVGERSVPHPCASVVAFGVARRGGVVDVGAQYYAYGGVVGGIETCLLYTCDAADDRRLV